MTNRALKKCQLNFFEEICTPSCKIKNERNLDPEGGLKMVTTRNKRIRLSLHRSSQYPLPRGLLIGF